MAFKQRLIVKPSILVLASLLTAISGCTPYQQSSNSQNQGISGPAAGQQLSNEPLPADPALAMQDRIATYPSPWPELQGLDSGQGNLRKLAGTLARIQFVATRDTSARRLLPTVLINANNQCMKAPTIGAYTHRCQTIKIDYTDGQMAYEHPAEIEAVLAHEWGHHIAQSSGLKVSDTEHEILADCFAGVVFGYYLNNQLITAQEAREAFEMMAEVSNNSESDIHPNKQVRTSAFLGGMSQIAEPQGQYQPLYTQTCGSLEQILDSAKVRSMGLSWP
jgi:hypothetical protein